MKRIVSFLFLVLIALSCSEKKHEKKGLQVNEISEDEKGEKVVGLPIDSLKLETRPRNVLSTYHPNHRITPIYKVNYNKKGKPFTGSNSVYRNWEDNYNEHNNWNNNFMPGFRAIYGYNFVNVSHYNNEDKTQNSLFDRPVLIKTFYYPAFSKDTLNGDPVIRDYYMVSVYDEDTNKDGFINTKDLRRLYFFDINGKLQQPLVPKNYSVISSEYDSANDFMYIFAKIDGNGNGKIEQKEPTHVFWVDLKSPEDKGVQYK